MSRAELVLLREALEGVVAPETATSLLFEALELHGKTPPSTLEETRAFAESSLAEAVKRKVRAEDASQIIKQIDKLFERAIEGDGVAVDVEVEPESWDEGNPAATTQMAVVKKPVPVVVLGATGIFAERLVACLGEDRVRAVPATDEASLRKAVFAYSPLIVLVDGIAPVAIEPAKLAAALHGLPDSALPVLWGSESAWSRSAVSALEAADLEIVTLDRSEGIEPLLDLVLARFRGAE
jgi:hypothetical protein